MRRCDIFLIKGLTNVNQKVSVMNTWAISGNSKRILDTESRNSKRTQGAESRNYFKEEQGGINYEYRN